MEIPVAGTLQVTAEDNAYIVDTLTIQSTNFIKVNDLTLVTENIQTGENPQIIVSDTTVTSELIDFGEGQGILVSDTTVTSENVTVLLPISIMRTSSFTVIIPEPISLIMIKLVT